MSAEGQVPPSVGRLWASMELAFRTRRLRTLCQDYDESVRMMGVPAADVLRTRLADLRAVTYLADLPAGSPDVIPGDPPQLRFELREGWALIMKVGHEVVPRTAAGQLDQTRVRRALVEKISR